MTAAILYGNYDGKGNAIVVRINNLADPLYTIGGYLIGFTKNNLEYYHFIKSDFKQDDKNSVDAGYYSLDDWLRYWADQIKIEEVRKFENAFFEHIKKGDTIIVQKHKVANDMVNYNINEEYQYVWNSDQYLIPFSEKIYIPANVTGVEKPYNPQPNATSFYNNSKFLIDIVSSEKKGEVARYLIYSAYCIHHINNSILPLFSESAYLALITEQKNFWSNPFTNTTGLSETEIVNIVHDFYLEVLNFYVTGFRNKKKIQSVSQNRKLFYLTLFMSVKALTTLTSKIKIEILKTATEEMSEYFEKETVENLIVRIAGSFDANTINRIDEFLEGLIKSENVIGKDQVTLYQYIYDRMSTSWNMKKGVIQLTNWIAKTNFKPTNTKSAFVQAIYSLWQFSKFNPYNEDGTLKTNAFYIKSLNPEKSKPAANGFFVEDSIQPTPNTLYNYSYETAYQVSIGVHTGWPYAHVGDTEHFYTIKYPLAAPISMPYESEKRIGIFFDNFTFDFKGSKIQATQNKLPWIETESYLSKYSETSQLYGTYDIFQPISLINNNIDSAVPLVTIYGDKIEIGNGNLTINSLIPIFMLKMIDDLGDKSDAETAIGYAVDGVLTFSGIGNLTKLRHLRWAALGVNEVQLVSKAGLRIVLGGVEFTSGVLGFLANFVECNANDEFCKSVKNFIMMLQLATLSVSSVDTLTTLALRNSARRITKIAGGTDANTIRQNVENRLKQLHPNASDSVIQQTSSAILGSSIIGVTPEMIGILIRRIKKLFEDKGAWTLDISYTNTFLNDYIKLCKDELGLTDKVIEELIFIANKKTPPKKFISTDQLIIQTKFHVNEILKRGFSAGFSNMLQYKSFCNKVRDQFKTNLLDLPGELSQHIDSLECVVKGSACRTWKTLDPEPPVGMVKPRQPDDIDLGLRLDADDYDAFVEELKMVIHDVILDEREVKILIDRINNKNTYGKLQYDEIFKHIPVGNSDFVKKIRKAAAPYTNFAEDNINFAIIKKGGKYDNSPEITFKY
ncbi:hypothetical protein DRF59_05845 [Chryseobacterium flavum]|uniref:Uncharacterized protein n=1 Tax=Chryseobacterium flavum TaxID=415851 RepID=A0A3D9CPY4_9FLAO|nr:hypothetical protein [Chryseobacterium flavum]REC67853.1 hypothetical protein DRF59_05845 [Chryseobacterium flavum]